MIIGILLGISVSVFLFSLVSLIIARTSIITAGLIGIPQGISYPLISLVVSSIMIVLIVIAIIKKHFGYSNLEETFS